MNMLSLRFLFSLIMLRLLIGCALLWAQSPSADPKPTAADAKPATTDSLRQLEADFMKAAAERGAEGYMSYYAEDAVEVPNGAEAIHGKANIGKTMGFLDDKNNQLTWTPVDAGISISGDLGWTSGTYEFRSKDKDGKVTIEHGKYTSIWKKQPDGNWKIVLDMGNASAEKEK
jgi:ketosteroid isomerase-like protein